MSNLDATIARLKALPESEQDAMAAQINELLNADDLLTPEEWAEIEARLDSGEKLTPHEDVVRDLEAKFR